MFKKSQPTTRVEVYRSDRKLRRGVSRLARQGWVPQAITQDKSRVAVRRSVLRGIFFPLLLFGLARTKPKKTVIFVRRSVTNG